MSALDATALPPPVVYDFAPVARELLGCECRVSHLRGERAAVLRSAIEEEIAARGSAVLSIDIFDTFLLRNDKPETVRYHELSLDVRERIAASLANAPSDIDLLIARLQGMDFSYRTRKAVDGCREGHIEQVIRVACAALGLPRSVETTFHEAELEYEIANLTLNPVLLDVANAFAARGGQIILVSDMYLGEAELMPILHRVSNGANLPPTRIFSSADHVVSKRAGKIFGLIEGELGLRANAFLHIGDSWQGDVVRCREAGWGAIHFPISRSEMSAREHALLAFVTAMKAQGHDLTRWARL